MELEGYVSRIRERLGVALDSAENTQHTDNLVARAFSRGRASAFREAIKIVNKALQEERRRNDMTDTQFIRRWQLWKKALASNDPNSLVSQMTSACWSIATHEAIRASWRTELAQDRDTLNVTPLLFHFITNHFSRDLCLDLRRLTEAGGIEENQQQKNDRSVYSIASLLTDIKECRAAFTRRRLFLATKLEYDAEVVRRRHADYIAKMMGGRTTAVFGVPTELWDYPTVAAHEDWDRVCRRTQADRTPEDVIAPEYLDYLEYEVGSVRRSIEFLVNKFFAHAATPDSRESAKDKETQVTINQLYELTLKCGRLINSMSLILRDAIYPFLATAQWNKWEDWGRGWAVDPRILEEAWMAWGDRVERLQPLFPAEW